MKNILVIMFLFFGLLLNAQGKKWTLQECVEYALENNISIRQSELDLEVAKTERLDAVGNFIPSLNASSSYAWNTGLTQNVTTGILQNQTTRNFSANLTAGMTLFDGLRNVRQLQRAKLSRLASQYNLELMKDNIALNVANAYLTVLFNKENLKVIQAQNTVTKEQLTRTQELVDAGMLPSGDLYEIRATDANEEQRIIVAQNDITISLINLAQMLLIKDYENFDIASGEGFGIVGEELLSQPVNNIIESAKENRYEIRVAEENRNIAEKDVEIARGAYLPTIGGFFNYNTRATDSRQLDIPFREQLYLFDGISYGFQLNVPILNGFATRNAVKRSKINVERASIQLEQAELDLESNVYQAYVDAKGALKAYEAALISLEAQEQAFQYATERYDVGLTNSFDFSQAKLRMENAQSEVVRTKYDYIFKLKVIELYFGIPVAELKF